MVFIYLFQNKGMGKKQGKIREDCQNVSKNRDKEKEKGLNMSTNNNNKDKKVLNNKGVPDHLQRQ